MKNVLAEINKLETKLDKTAYSLKVVGDPEKKLLNMLEHICKMTRLGHSFYVDVDPQGDDNERLKVGFDGDGAEKLEISLL